MNPRYEKHMEALNQFIYDSIPSTDVEAMSILETVLDIYGVDSAKDLPQKNIRQFHTDLKKAINGKGERLSATEIETLSLKDAALSYAALGYKIFPITRDRKAPPAIKEWQKQATNDVKQIEKWWSELPNANIGLHCNELNGKSLLVLDVDVKNGGEKNLEALLRANGQSLPKTLVNETPSGGFHAIYFTPTPLKNTASKLATGIDTRAAGGYILLPPSTVGGKKYKIKHNNPITDAANWLIEALTIDKAPEPVTDAPTDIDQSTAITRAADWLKTAPSAIEGQGGDAHTYQIIARVRDFGVDKVNCDPVLTPWNERCEPPWSPDELQTKIDNVYKYGQNAPGCNSVEAMFEIVPVAEVATDKEGVEPKTGLLLPAARHVRSIYKIKPGPELWENALLQQSIFAFTAGPGRHKSNLATLFAYELARDSGEFLGREIPKGFAAMYVDVERIATTEVRLAAWAEQDRIDPENLPLLLKDNFNLLDPTDVSDLIEELRETAKRLRRDYGLVMFDSLGAIMQGMELNSSGAGTRCGTVLRQIRDAVGCAVGVVAHTPKSRGDTVAGTTHFDAIFDFIHLMQSHARGQHGRVYIHKKNPLPLDERDCKIPWTCKGELVDVDGRILKVERLIAGSQDQDDLHEALRLIYEVADDRGEVASRVVLNAWRDSGLIARGKAGLNQGRYIFPKLIERGWISKDGKTVKLSDDGLRITAFLTDSPDEGDLDDLLN